MKLNRSHLYCDLCGKQKGKNFNHDKCSRFLQKNGARKETKYKKISVHKLERHIEYFLEDRGETPAYLETALDYRALERLKNGG